MNEIWKSIKNYEGLYEISNWGNVKSLKRKGRVTEKMLNPYPDTRGYLCFDLQHNGRKSVKIHKVVWDHFGDKPRNSRILQVDHINADKTNNRIDNLQLLTNRENCSKGHRDRGRSLPTGVFWRNDRNRYYTRIYANGKNNYLGMYKTIEETQSVYQEALGELDAVHCA